MYPYVVLLAQLALGVIWVAAALAKLTTRQFGRHAIARFNLLPSALASVVGIVLPWTELSLGGLLLSGQWTRAAAGASVVVLSVFTFAIVVSLVRGDHVECSCFGQWRSNRISWWSVARNAGLAALAAIAALPASLPLGRIVGGAGPPCE